MKKYRKYMSGVKAPDTLHQKLLELETPAKRPVPWKRYGCIAAALVLVLGLGGVGYAHYYNTVVNPTGDRFLELTQAFDPADYPEIAPAIAPDIAPVEPGDIAEPGQKTLGGYEVVSGSGENAMVTYYILPYIEYGDTSGQATAADWDIPKGAARRDLTQEEIVALMGGEDAVNTHLDWGGYELSGWGAWYEDGSFWGAYINGTLLYVGSPASQFEFAVTAGQLPPTCFGYPDSVTQEIRGLTVTADQLNWETETSDGRPALICERRVSFMKDGYGYRFEMSCAGSGEPAEELVSRLVCRIAGEGLALWTVDQSLKTYTCSTCGQTLLAGTGRIHCHTYVDFPVGEPNLDGLRDGSAQTAPYDPNAAVAPSYDAPPVSVSDAPGAGPDEAMCSGYPVPERGAACPICGEAVPEGMEHSHELCAYPLAPDPAESWEISDGHPLAPEGWTGPSRSPDVSTKTIYD